MKQTLAAGESFPAVDFGDAYNLLDQILLGLFPAHSQEVLQISKAFRLHEVQLGDELHSAVDSISDCCIVCQGRVRLICADKTHANTARLNVQSNIQPSIVQANHQPQPIAAALLEAGDTWGADHQFCNSALPYGAIAASPGLIAVLPDSTLQQWLQQFPPLQDYLRQTVLTRQRLLFFKTATVLRSQPSHLLKRFLPYLAEMTLSAGTVLTEATPTSAGRYWLRSGTIATRSNEDSGSAELPAIGDFWGYPNTVSPDGVAATDLQIYHLPSQHWEAAVAGFPALDQTANQSISRRAPQTARPLRLPLQGSPETPPVTPSQTARPSFQPPVPPESAAIDFAKPIRKRFGFRQSYPFIQQQSSSDCGAACLAMISQYWGKRLSLNLLRNLAGVGRSGASLRGVARAAEQLGFLARPVRASLNRMAEQTMPWIAHWQGDHYVVVYRVKRDRVLLSDPAVGRRSLSLEEFQAGWTGYALLLTPTEFLKTLPAAKFSLGRFWGAFLPYRSMLVPIALASIVLQVLGVVTPLFTQIILDQVVVHKNLITLNVFIIGLLLCSTWRIGLVSVRQYFLDYFSNQVDLTLISGFISHTLNLPLRFFADRHVGDIVTRVQENHKVQLFLTRQVFATGLDALMAFVYVGLMFYYNWQLTILVLGILPPIVLLTVIASPFLRRVSRQIFHDSARQNSSLVEMLTGIAAVKTAAAEREVRWQWEEDLTSQFNAQFRGQKLANVLQGLSGFINVLGSTALLWYGASLVIQDRLTIGQLVAFNMMIGSVIGPVLALVGLWDELQEVMVSVERLEDIFNTPAEESADKPLLTLPTIRGEVCFENVTFRYGEDDSRNILQNVSFVAQPGETIALVGRSGSGKTTLANLLQGLYHPTSGRITIDGHDIRHISPQSLRHQLGIVPQECFLFSGTILDNITLYRPEYSLESVIEVAKLAEAHAFIQNLPLGYSSKVGERGSTLSGGQRQRIAIARALLSNPQILILDEATSSLDTESERRFQKNLHYISRDRTTLIIAHRLATVRHADRILVLDQGIVVEQGTHDQLIAQQGLYAQLAQQQLDI
ncbi:ABC transporter transmembrane domain-containing protein [Leptolyngbya ohadii]|uniref:ABC transporter transmembrane domain-containing protein n=1 Tax=Leptolyngbya ohadii TaxID=1962290 RepID=UPI000B59E811|nr:ABC transporter transmembrane domain-containing protein [Leptolyngbya ohadii]